MIGVKVLTANCNFFYIFVILGLTEVVPYELVRLTILAVPDALRKLFKLNTEAVALVLRELDFWVPFVTGSLSAFCAWASFTHEGAAAAFAYLFTVLLVYTVNILLGKPKGCAYGANLQQHLSS